jgi:predicted signal transduction protein with EAL and GGDEF domain
MRRGESVARLGGDEFAVLCPGIGAAAAAAIADRLVDAVAALRFAAPTQTLRVGCSIGIAAYPQDAGDEDELVACADTAMYQAKQNGKNGWAAYRDDPLQPQAESPRINWNTRIHRALHDRRFALHFQPVLRAADLQVVHLEALLRMVDEDDPARLVSPADFLPHAERSGRVRLIDRWVFEACIERLARLDPALGIAAHLSSRSLEDPDVPGFLRDMLQRHDVDPRRLTIELTEASALVDPIAALRGVGCAVHLDGFGGGFNSLAHLKLLDVDAIKVGATFVRGLQSDATSRMLVAAMIDIAHGLNKLAIAEHVEDAATLEILRGLGIDLVQGFHLGRPTARLADGRPRGRLQAVAGSGAAGG